MKVHPIPGLGFDSNIFVVESGEAIVVDAGTGQYVERTLQTIKGLECADNIEKLVLTHRHCDHAGGADVLADALGVEMFAPPLEAEALRNADVSTGASMFGVPMGPLEVKDLGGELDLGGEKLKVLHTPGHTEGSGCLHHEASGTLICGDVIFCDGGVGRWDLPGGNLEQLVASVALLAELEPKGLYPGHGSWTEDDGRRHVKLAKSSLGLYSRMG